MCHKGSDQNYDISIQLLEWILLAEEQGYGQVNMYFYPGFHPQNYKIIRLANVLQQNVNDNLRYFKKKGFVEVFRIEFAKEIRVFSKKFRDRFLLNMEHVTWTDCLQR